MTRDEERGRGSRGGRQLAQGGAAGRKRVAGQPHQEVRSSRTGRERRARSDGVAKAAPTDGQASASGGGGRRGGAQRERVPPRTEGGRVSGRSETGGGQDRWPRHQGRGRAGQDQIAHKGGGERRSAGSRERPKAASRPARLPELPTDLPPLAPGVRDDLRSAAGRQSVDELASLLSAAAALLERGREDDALAFALELKRRAPRSRFGREALGIVQYQLGRYRAAVAELRAYRRMSGDHGRDVVLADAERGAGNVASARRRLEAVMADTARPEADRVEARIVLAAMARDEGRLDQADALLRSGPVSPRGLEEHHLRLWYALGDLAEDRGRDSEALEWFSRIDVAEPGWGDAAERRRALERKLGGSRARS